MLTAKKIFLACFLILCVYIEKDDCTSNQTYLNNLLSFLQITQLTQSAVNKAVTNIDPSQVDVAFLLHLQDHSIVPINSKSATKYLQFSRPTKIITHGWTVNGTTDWIKKIARAYKQRENCNVISVDWSKTAKKNYIYAASATQIVGSKVGDFVVKMRCKSEEFLTSLHLIGHSLGGHVMSFAAKRIYNRTNQRVDRLSGLDVAAPLFEIPFLRPPALRLDNTDAEFVDVIHTQAGSLGFVEPIGHVDFYPNSGYEQPQCMKNPFSILYCGHGIAPIYFANSIKNLTKYQVVACDNFVNYKRGVCKDNAKNYMGEGADRDKTGMFYSSVKNNN